MNNSEDSDLQTPSLTSTNNFINFCVGSGIINGEPTGQESCNPAPMGAIPSKQNLPGTRFTSPRNGAVFVEDESIPVVINTTNLAFGNMVNPQLNFLAAPQQLNADGVVIGHYHLVVDSMESFDQLSPTNPAVPALFVELGTETQPLSTNITLPAGFYRITASPHAANHQPVIVSIEQHSSFNDVVYVGLFVFRSFLYLITSRSWSSLNITISNEGLNSG